MLASTSRQKERPGLLLTLFVTVGMALLCIACAAWLVAMWNLFPRINFFYPNLQTELLLALAMMVLATLTALFAFIRGTLALRAVHASPPEGA